MRRAHQRCQRRVRRPSVTLTCPWVLLLCLLVAAPADATEVITWIQPAGGTWGPPVNWDPMDTPDEAGETALIPDDGWGYTITMDLSPTLDEVRCLNPAATLSLWARRITTVLPGGLTNHGTILADNGTSTISANILNAATGRVEVLNNKLLLLFSPTFTNDGSIVVNADEGIYSATLRFDADALLTGSGELLLLGEHYGDSYVRTQDATLTQGANHTAHGVGTIGAALVNDGTIRADVPHQTLRLTTDPKTNRGLFQAADSAFLKIEQCTVTQDAAGIIDADGAIVEIRNATVSGGTFTTANAGEIQTYNACGLSDITNQGLLHIHGLCPVAVTGETLTNDAIITVNPTEYYTAYLRFDDDITLQGSGEMILHYQSELTTSGTVLTHAAAHTIRGGGGRFDAEMINDGVIIADDRLHRHEFSEDPKTNNNLILAVDEAEIFIEGCAITQGPAGIIMADSATIQLRHNAAITGGTLSTANGGIIKNEAGTVSLTDITNAGDYAIRYGCTTMLAGGELINDGTMIVNYGGSYDAYLGIASDFTLEGCGEVVLNSNSAEIFSDPGTLTIAADHTIRGRGKITAPTINQGSILADESDDCVFVEENTVVNNASMRATNGGQLQTRYGGTLINNATLEAAHEGEVGVHTNGLIDNQASIWAESLGEVRITGGELINRASLWATEHGKVDAIGGSLRNEGDLWATDSSTVHVYGSATVTNEGTLWVEAGSTLGMIFAGGGTLINHGILRAAENGYIDIDEGTFLNQGTAEATGGGEFYCDRLANHYVGGALSGGNWHVYANSTMRLRNADVHTLAARVLLDGPNSNLYRDGGTTEVLGNLETIAGGGLLEVASARNYDHTGDLLISYGELRVGEGCTFSVDGQYSQVGNEEIPTTPGLTCVNGTFVATVDSVAILGGHLCGNGTIMNSVMNLGRANPGASAGELTITGDYTQTEEGTCWIELAGLNAGEYDHLLVGGEATLSGRLVVTSIEGYEPQVGDRFTILSCATRSGEFTLETGSPGEGLLYETFYYPDHIEIEITGDPSYVPEPEIPEDTPGAPSDGTEIESDDPFDTPERIPTALNLYSRPLAGGGALLVLDLPRTSQVTLEIFDFSGRRVALLADGPESAGRHSYTWSGMTQSGARAASGVYFARAGLQGDAGGDDIATARVLLTR